jgi:hypothetical protein
MSSPALFPKNAKSQETGVGNADSQRMNRHSVWNTDIPPDAAWFLKMPRCLWTPLDG